MDSNYWLKSFRARSMGVLVEEHYDNEGHIRQCGKMFIRSITEPYLGTLGNTGISYTMNICQCSHEIFLGNSIF